MSDPYSALKDDYDATWDKLAAAVEQIATLTRERDAARTDRDELVRTLNHVTELEEAAEAELAALKARVDPDDPKNVERVARVLRGNLDLEDIDLAIEILRALVGADAEGGE